MVGISAPLPVPPKLAGLPIIPAPPVNLIIDTDQTNDCDDTGAEAIACGLQKLGFCNISAIIVTSKNTYAAAACWQIIRYCLGPNSIPIAAYNGTSSLISFTSAYTQTVAQGSWGASPSAAPGSFPGHVPVARQAMSDLITAGQQAVYVVIGTWTSLIDILNSPADGISPLTGLQLFTAAISRMCIMGGNDINGNNTTPEYNLASDPVSVAACLALLPNSIERVWSPFQLGNAIATVPVVCSTSPISVAYTAVQGSGVGRQSWDPTAVLYAILGDRGIFDIVARKITNSIYVYNGAGGYTGWNATPGADTCLGLKSSTSPMEGASASTLATMINNLFALGEPTLTQGAANASNVFTGMAGLQWWTAPSDPSTVSTVSGKVTKVLDLSGNNFHAIPAPEFNTRLPAYAANSVNSLGALSFASTNFMAMDGLAPLFNSPATPFHIFMLVKAAALASEGCFFSLMPANPVNHYQSCISLAENASQQLFFGRDGVDAAAAYTTGTSAQAISTSAWVLLEAKYDPTAAKNTCLVSGGTAAQATAGTPTLNLVSARLMGKYQSDSSTWNAPGLLAEAAVFNAVQTGTNRSGIISRINARYGTAFT